MSGEIPNKNFLATFAFIVFIVSLTEEKTVRRDVI